MHKSYCFISKARLTLIFSLFILGFGTLFAQGEGDEGAAEDTSKIELIFSRKMRGLENAQGSYLHLEGEVHLKQEQMHLWCDTAHRYPLKQIIAFGDVQMVQNDSIRIFSDSLFYDGNTKKARLSGDVVLQDSSMTMFTDQLYYDLNTKIATYPFGALVVTDSSKLVSRSGSYDANTNMAYFTDSVRLTDPNYKLVADSLAFNTDREIAYFRGPTFIYNEEDMVYCEGGYFDNRKNYSELTGNPYYLKRNEEGYQKAKGDTIIYNGSENRYYLIGNAVYEDGDKEVRADTIVRDGDSDQFYFKGSPKFRSLDSTQNQTIDAKYSFYDSKTETVIFRDEVRVVDKSQILVADSLDYTKKTRIGIARGHVVWMDTVSNVQIICGEAIYNDSTGSFLAKEHPILVTKLDKDSLWLTADTLRAVKDSLNEEKKTFYAYYNVRLYKSDMQGLCDSLTYSEADSLFEFLGNPILWVDSVQFTADTIRAILSNKKIDKIFLKENSLIVSSYEEVYFNQIKGRNMLARFKDNKINDLDVKLNGEAIYYVQDDQKRYMGVNDVDCSNMFMYFKENQVDRIRFTGEPQATLYPMGQVNHSGLRLKNYQWLEEKRPKTKFEITGGRDWSSRLALAQPHWMPMPELPKSDSIQLPQLPENPTPPDSLRIEPNLGKGNKMKNKEGEPAENKEVPKTTENPVSTEPKPTKGSKMKKKEGE